MLIQASSKTLPRNTKEPSCTFIMNRSGVPNFFLFSEAAIAFDNPIEQQQMKVDISHPTQEACCSKQENTEYINRKEITFPESSQQPLDRKVNCTAGPQNAWPNGSTRVISRTSSCN